MMLKSVRSVVLISFLVGLTPLPGRSVVVTAEETINPSTVVPAPIEGLGPIQQWSLDFHPFFHAPVANIQDGEIRYSPYLRALHIGYPPPTEAVRICATAPTGQRYCSDEFTGVMVPSDTWNRGSQQPPPDTRFAVPFRVDNAWPSGQWIFELFFDDHDAPVEISAEIRVPEWSVRRRITYSPFEAFDASDGDFSKPVIVSYRGNERTRFRIAAYSRVGSVRSQGGPPGSEYVPVAAGYVDPGEPPVSLWQWLPEEISSSGPVLLAVERDGLDSLEIGWAILP